MEFDTAGELTAMQDKEGNRREITYATYNGMKYIQKITDGAGQALTLHIDNSGYLDYIEDTAGRRTTYYYDASRRLTRHRLPRWNQFLLPLRQREPPLRGGERPGRHALFL